MHSLPADDPRAAPDPSGVPPLVVVDTEGRRYHLSDVVGFGGQGVVYRDDTGESVVKIQRPPLENVTTAVEGFGLRRRYERLRQLRTVVPEELPLVLPTAVLAPPKLGYVMPRVRGHRALTNLLRPDANCDFAPWFHTDTGGLRRRYLLGARLARAFHYLHSLGLAYGDLSDTNVLVAQNPRLLTFCLIDPDNLSFSDLPRTGVLGTERYIAPELLRGAGLPDYLTDCHALATLLFHLLRLGHPLLGDAILDAEPEAEEAALRGDVPYVEHPDDDRNRASHLLPAELTLTKVLQRLFHRAFVDGLVRQRALRPGPREWEGALLAAADNLSRCTDCNADYLPRQAACPWCGTAQPEPQRLVFRDQAWSAGKPMHRKVATMVLPFPAVSVVGIPRRLTQHGAEGGIGDEWVCLLRLDPEQGVTLENRSPRAVFLVEYAAQGAQVLRLAPGDNRVVTEKTSVYFEDPFPSSTAVRGAGGADPTGAIRCMHLSRGTPPQDSSTPEVAP